MKLAAITGLTFSFFKNNSNQCTAPSLIVSTYSPVAGVLDEPYSQLTAQLSSSTVQARQYTYAGTVSILCSLAGRYNYSYELA